MTKIGKKAAQDYKDKLKGKYKFMFDLKEKQKCLITNIMERKNSIGIFPTEYSFPVYYHNKYLICDKSRLLHPPSCFSGSLVLRSRDFSKYNPIYL
jgi:hypothetical protein